ncbi:hypothetical protein ACFL1R_03100 [Candidatus Latescibacterota bacterium]
MKKDSTVYRYTLKGPEMVVVDEKLSRDGVTVWNKRASGFNDVNSVLFPRKLSIENSHGVVDMEFSRCSINSGLTENDLVFELPSSAERIVF